MQKTLITFGSVLGIIVLAAVGYYAQSRMLGAAETNIVRTCTASSTLVSSTTSTVVFATSSGARRFARVSNDDPTSELYLSIGNAAVRGRGIHLEPNDEVVFDLDMLAYTAVYGIASSGPVSAATIDCK